MGSDIRTEPAAPAAFRLWRWLGAIHRAYVARSHCHALLELSDDQLKDIGLSRTDAYGGYSRFRRSTSASLERDCL